MRLLRYFATLTALVPVLILWQHLQPVRYRPLDKPADNGCSLMRAVRSEACQREAESGGSAAWLYSLGSIAAADI